MKIKKPLVSVVLNNYNYGRFLAEALQSVLDQSYPHKEIIVVDDGSTDESRAVIRSYERRYPGRFRAILKENGGQASALNAGFSASTGEIVCFLDSDDYWFGRKIESIIEPHRTYGFVQHNLLTNGRRYRLLVHTGDLRRFLKEFGLIRSCVPTSAQSFRRDVLEKLFPLPEEDMRICADVWLRCGALYWADAYSMDDCLGVYRVHGGNAWQTRMSREKPNIAADLVSLFNRRLAESGHPPIPIRTDAREQSFLASIPIKAGWRYLLYGAGDMGVKLARRIRAGGGFPIAFIDDNPRALGANREGLPVLPPEAIAVWRDQVDRIVVAAMCVEQIYEKLADEGFHYPDDVLLPIDLEAHISSSVTSPAQAVGQEDLSPPAYYCPVCRLPVREWQPFIRRVTDDQWREEPEPRLCPYCRSFERTRQFVLFLAQCSILERLPRVLHVAPEPGLRAFFQSRLRERYLCMDLMAPHVDISADLTRLPFPDGRFDFIYCSNVLEHIPDDRRAMNELFRVLAPGGLAYLQVPVQGQTTQEDLTITDATRRTKLYGQADHVRMYGADIQSRLEQAGFRVEAARMPDYLKLSTAEQKRFNCAKKEIIHLCTKQPNNY